VSCPVQAERLGSWHSGTKPAGARLVAAVVKDFQNAYGIEKSAMSENFIEAGRYCDKALQRHARHDGEGYRDLV
jgi:hypothetical protein